MDCCQKLKHRLLVYHYKNMLNKNYERTEVLAYILSKYSKKYIRDPSMHTIY